MDQDRDLHVSCRAVVECLPWLASGRLPAGTLATAYQHLACCRDCRRELGRVLALRAALDAALIALPALSPTTGAGFAARVALAGGAAWPGQPWFLDRVLAWLDAAGTPVTVMGLLRWAVSLPANASAAS